LYQNEQLRLQAFSLAIWNTLFVRICNMISACLRAQKARKGDASHQGISRIL
jgi:hypothetical protein